MDVSIVASASSESPPNGTPTITSEGNFHFNPNTFQSVLHVPLNSITAFDSPPLMTPSGEYSVIILMNILHSIYSRFKKLCLDFDQTMCAFGSFRWICIADTPDPRFPPTNRLCVSTEAHICVWWVRCNSIFKLLHEPACFNCISVSTFCSVTSTCKSSDANTSCFTW